MVRFVILIVAISLPAYPLYAAEAEKPGIRIVGKLGGGIITATGVEGRHVVAVRLASSALTDQQLADLTCLSRLERLDISRTGVSEESLGSIVKFRRLRSLNLEGTPVTDAVLKRLTVLTQMEDLNLARTKVTVEGLKGLSSFKRLRCLILEAGQLNDDVLRVLRDTRAISTLRLADKLKGPMLDGDGAIEYWDLSETPFSKLGDKLIASLGRYTGLKVRVSEAERDLARLGSLKHLSGLVVLGR